MPHSRSPDASGGRQRILVLSAYDTDSHRLWRTRVQSMLPAYDWTHLSLPPRHFNWRIRGNSLQWGLGDHVSLNERHDAILATSMVDLASLRGFRPELARIPTIVYFHENQFNFPADRQRMTNIEPILVPVYAALCAERIVFNSQFNRSSFLAGVERLFQTLPDKLDASIMEKLEDSQVLPVPLAADELQGLDTASEGTVLEVVWNHRWEHDKNPNLLLSVVELLQESALPVRLHVLGRQFRHRPRVFEIIDAKLDSIAEQQQLPRGQFGFLPDRRRYLEFLARCDVVLSTALHEFQGLALQEACALGCTPLAPDALVYPEYLNDMFLFPVSENGTRTAAAIVQSLEHWHSWKAAGRKLPKASMEQYLDSNLGKRYESLIRAVIDGG